MSVSKKFISLDLRDGLLDFLEYKENSENSLKEIMMFNDAQKLKLVATNGNEDDRYDISLFSNGNSVKTISLSIEELSRVMIAALLLCKEGNLANVPDFYELAIK